MATPLVNELTLLRTDITRLMARTSALEAEVAALNAQGPAWPGTAWGLGLVQCANEQAFSAYCHFVDGTVPNDIPQWDGSSWVVRQPAQLLGDWGR